MVIEFRIKDIFIRNDKKTLKIFYGDNGDLYFDIFGYRDKDQNDLNTAIFSIGEREEVYQYFE